MVNSENYSRALIRLGELLSKVNLNADIFISKEKVLARYKPIFSHSQVSYLEQGNLVEFLHYKEKNRHWTDLQRQRKNLVSNMDKLREALFFITDETIPIDQRIDKMPKVKGLGNGILTPILMVSNEKEYGVWNAKTEKFFNDFDLIPNRKKNTGKFYEEVNSILHRFSKDLNIGLWELDALFHYYITLPDVSKEIHRRKDLFNSLKRNRNGYVDNTSIRQNRIRFGQRQIISRNLPHINEDVTLSILSTGKDYSDKLSGTSLEYDAPNTTMREIDKREISGMVAAMHYKIPIFVVIENKTDIPKRRVFMGLVKDYDNDRNKFLIDLLDKFPEINDSDLGIVQNQTEDFKPYELERNDKEQLVKARRNQTRFRYGVLKRYGTICSVCNFDIEEAIEAAHIIPKGSKGSDDLRNGLPMCANHHKLFDANYFAFDKKTNIIMRNGIVAEKLGISKSDLTHLRNLPHPVAIAKREASFRSS